MIFSPLKSLQATAPNTWIEIFTSSEENHEQVECAAGWTLFAMSSDELKCWIYGNK